MKDGKVSIRRFIEDDLQDLSDLLSDAEVMKYLEEPFDYEKTRSFLYSAALTENPLILAVENDNGNFVGYVIFHPFDQESYEIGWVLAKEYWGKGYASELTKMLIDKAKDKTDKLIIECCPEQMTTKKIAISHGFKYCKTDSGCDIYVLNIKK